MGRYISSTLCFALLEGYVHFFTNYMFHFVLLINAVFHFNNTAPISGKTKVHGGNHQFYKCMPFPIKTPERKRKKRSIDALVLIPNICNIYPHHGKFISF